MPPDHRKAAEARGRRSEWVAALWLMLRGWRLKGRRLKTPAGEIDLLMQRGDTLIYVEVKARASLDAAQDALTPRSRQRMARAARLLMHNHDEQARLNHRCDAVLIAPGHFPRHIEHITPIH
jgi:putative endonuclease